MTTEILSLVAGVILSLLFSYIPGLSTWFGKLEAVYKRLIMLLLLLIVSIGVYALSCAGWYSWVICDKTGALELLKLFIYCLIANQSAYMITPLKDG